MTQRALTSFLWLIVLLLMSAARVQAQSEAGTVAAVQSPFDVQHAAGWQGASIGLPVFVGDRLRTGANGRGKVVFQDDSVLDLAPNTELAVEKQLFDPPTQHFQSLLRLAKGKIRAWVSDYYHEPHARYEVETPTAVIGVRGTEFIVLYDVATELTEVVGVDGQVDVSGKLAVIGAAVQVGPRQRTQVQKGRFPSTPEDLDEQTFQRYVQDLDLIGTGRRDGLNVLHPLIAGRLQSPDDVPGAAGAAAAAAKLGVGPPQTFLASRLSKDVATNTQPLLDFQQTPPGQAPSGAVKVGF